MTTPETAALAAVDEALELDAVTERDAELRELQELALALRADAPEPSPGFRAAMETRLAARPSRRLFALPAAPRAKLPVLTAAASLLLALVVTVGVLSGGEDEPRRQAPPSGAPPQAAEDSAGARSAEPPASGATVAPEVRERRIERSAELTLAAAPDRLQEIADRIIAVTDRHDGFVLRSGVATGAAGGGGDFDLRIPRDRLRAALRDLSALGDVRSRSEEGRDVTRRFGSASERLEEARADRRGLLRRLELATTEERAAAIRRRLRLVSSEIRALTRRLAALRERVDYAVVSVSLVADEEDEDEGGAGLGDAFDDSLGTLEGSVEVALRMLAALLPFALVALPAWAAGRALLRRRREAALS